MNFPEVSNSKSEFFSTFHELEVHLAKFIGESSSKFIERVSSKAKEKDRLGLVIDLSLATFRENVRVMVIDAGRITRDTPDQNLYKAVEYVITPGECEKTRIVCAVVHRNHYDLGVVRTARGVCAVFAVGQEWDEACSLILRFVKANSAPAGQESVSLCPKWSEQMRVREDR
jgi:hypothetical protein